MKHVIWFLKSGLMGMIVSLILSGYTYAQTATATGSGTWDPQTQTGTATWSGGTGTGGSPATGNSIVISPGVSVTLTNNGIGSYNGFDNQSGSPSGFDLGAYTIYFSGNISGGCAGSEGSILRLTGIGQNLSGTYTADSVVFGGSGTKTVGSTSTLYGDVLINSGVTVSGNGTTLNIYGNITNYGTTTYSSGGTTINVYGNLTNHGTWNTYTTNVRAPALITGTGLYENDLILDTTCRISGKVSVERLTVPAGDSLLLPLTADTLVTSLQSVISGVVYGSGVVYYNHNITSANTEVSDLHFAGISQTVSGIFTSPQITFGGSANKTIVSTTTLYGNVLINSGVTVTGNGTMLNIYGNITNYGTTTYSSGGTAINAYGNLINYGTWNTYTTYVRIPALITGTGMYENDLIIDTTCRISGKVRVERLTVPAGDSLLLPDPVDTLVTSLPTVISGVVQGSGVVHYNGNITSAYTEVSDLYFAGISQTVIGIFTSPQITFGGSATKTIGSTTTLYGDVFINSGVTISGNGTTLNIYGDITNYGTTTYSSGGTIFNVYGNLTNNGTWKTYTTHLWVPALITGTGMFENDLIIDTTCRISGKVSVQRLTVQAGDSLLLPATADTLVTSQQSVNSGVVYGSGIVYYNHNITSANTNVAGLYFSGISQSVSGSFTSPQIAFGGSSTKTIISTTTLYGHVLINSGVTVSGNGSTMDIYGNITNYGTTTYSSGGTIINAYGNLTNHGTWNAYTTHLRVPALITGTGMYENDLIIDTTCRVSGKVSVQRLTVTAGDSLLLPATADTLLTSQPTVISGVLQGSGVVYFSGNITSAKTTIPKIFFSGTTFTFSGTFTADSIVFMGSGTKTFLSSTTLYGDVLINSGVTVSGNGTTLNVYGNITNFGTTSYSSGGTTINAYGNLTNNGRWNTYTTNVRIPALITGTGLYENDLVIDTTCRISGKVSAERLTVTAGDSLLLPTTEDTLVTSLQTVISGVVYGIGVVYYNNNITSANTGVSGLFFAGGSQSVNGTFTAPQITFGGSATKTIASATSLYGNVLISSGVTVSGNSTTLNVYGNITNYGVTTYSSGATTINAYGSLTNHGTWNTYYTNVKLPAVIAGTGTFQNQMRIDTTCSIAGTVSIWNLTVSAGDSLIVPSLSDTLITTAQTTISGIVWGNGIVYYNAAIGSAITRVSQIYFAGSSQTFSGTYMADSIIFNGSGNKNFSNVSLNGIVLINSGVTLLGNNDSLYVYGSLTNYGTTTYSSNPTTIRITNNLLNFGTWNTYYTFLTDTGLTGGSFTNSSGYFYINADRRLSGNLSLAGYVTLNGIVSTATQDTFTVNTSSFIRTSGYIDGNLRMLVVSGSPVIEYPLGDAAGYTPVTVSFSNVTAPGKMTVSLMSGAHPALAYPDSALKRYWKFSSDALSYSSFTPTLRYLAVDFNTGITEPLDESTMIAGLSTLPRWTYPDILSRTPGGSDDGGSMVIGNLTQTGDLVIARDTFAYNVNLPPEVTSPVADTLLNEDFGNVFIAGLNTVFGDPDNAQLNYTAAVVSGDINAYLQNDSLFLSSVLNAFGVAVIKVSAFDGWSTVSDTFAVTVTPVNDLPSAVQLLEPANDSALTGLSQPIVFKWRKSSDADGDTLRYSLRLSGNLLDTTIITVTDTSHALSDPDRLKFGSSYSWHVTVSDGTASVACPDTFMFRTPASVSDTVPAQLTTGLLISTVLKHYADLYTASSEPMKSVTAFFELRDASTSDVKDSSTVPMQKLGGKDSLYYTPYKISEIGKLSVTVTGLDTADNVSRQTKEYTINSFLKSAPLVITGEEGSWSVTAEKHTASEDGWIVTGWKPAVAGNILLMKSLKQESAGYACHSDETPVGGHLEILSTAGIRSGKYFTVRMRYTAEDVLALKGRYADFDERKIGLYQQNDDAWVYLGGEGITGQVTGRMKQPGKIALRYNPEHEFLPQKSELAQNYPNPFNPATTIRFGLPQESKVRLTVYNILGQKVKELADEVLPAGYHTVRWDGRTAQGSRAASGLYLYRLETPQGSLTRKMLLVK